MFMGIAAGEIEEEEFVAWRRTHTRPNQLSEPAATYR